MIELNAIIYWTICFLYIYYVKKFNLGALLLTIYAISATFSIPYYRHDYFSLTVLDTTVTFGPFIYLFVVLMLFFVPLLKFREDSVREIINPPINKLLYLSYPIILISVISIFIYIPLAKNGMSGDILDNRTGVMNEGLLISNPVYDTISKLQLIIKEFTVLLFFYMVTFQKARKTLNILLGISAFVPSFLYSLAFSARGTIFYLLISFTVCFFIFKSFISKKIRRIIHISFLSLIIPFIVVFVIITNSRFSDNDVDIMFWQYKYAGENFVNFNGILFDKTIGTTDGDTCFPLGRKMLGFTHKTSLSDYREDAEIITGVPCFVFYFFVGDLYLDFGKTITFLIALLLCVLGLRYFRFEKAMPFHRIILFELYYLICIQGLFIFPFQNMEGNLLILFHILMYFYFRIDFKNKILEER